MLSFTATPSGQDLINNATEGTNPVIIDSVVLYNLSDTPIKTITDISGSVFNDASGIGSYCKFNLNDLTSTAYTISRFALKSGSTEIAVSERVSIDKVASKGLLLEVSCLFAGAYKCSFKTISIALPYATNFREGIVRFANGSEETQKANTVYSAQKIDNIVDEIISGGVDLSGYVNWDKVGSTVYHGNVTVKQIKVVDSLSTPSDIVAISLDINGKLNIDGLITGNAVSSTPTISSGSLTGSDKVVNETYISCLYASEISENNANKLVTSSAVISYIQNQIDPDIVHKSGAETLTGIKTFNANIATGNSSIITGSAVQSDYDNGQNPSTIIWNDSSNYSKLPTVEVVSSALSSLESNITTDYQTADNNLQSQIDGINAGQNLADIVDLISNLKDHSLTDLKAKNAYKKGSSGAVWPIGDKIQVLHDQTNSSGVIVPSMDGVATVYELVKGTPSGSKDQVSTVDNAYYWHYIGQYGVDAYTKSESDSKFVISANLDQTILTTSSTTNAPSTKAVYDHVDGLISGLSSTYVKLTSSSEQIINSTLKFRDTSSSTQTVSIQTGNVIFTSGYGIKCVGETRSSALKITERSLSFSTILGGTEAALINLSVLDSSTYTPDIYGSGVANYRDVSNSSLVDGRLATIDYINHLTDNLTAYAKLSALNTFTGTTNTFAEVSATSYSGTGVYSSYNSTSWGTATTQIPNVSSVKSAISDANSSTLNKVSTINEIGSVGLFIYTEVGDERGYGETVSGSYLKPAGISLPMSGQITYKAVNPSISLTGTWRLLSAAVKRTATEPCLVMAQKISNS